MAESFKEQTILGRTGLKTSRLGIGAGYGVPASAIIKAYREYSVNYFYWGTRKAGMKEAIRTLAPTERDKIVIALQSYDHLGFYIPRSVEKGLRALGVEYVDVLILGWHNRYPSARIIESALKCREQGKIRFLAISGHQRKMFRETAQRADAPFDIFMMRYNAAHTGAEKEVFPQLPAENRPGMTIYTATRWGNLLKPKKMPPGEAPLSASDCYRFVLSNPNVDLCMTGPKNDKEMDEALLALERGPLAAEEMERVRRIGDYIRK